MTALIRSLPALTLIMSTQALGRTLVVSPLGDDDNPGTAARPLATPHRALELARSGDAINLRGGAHVVNRPIWIDKSDIHIASFGTERATLTAPNAAETDPVAVFIIAADSVTLSGLEIVGGSYYGVKIEPDGREATRGITLRNCRIRDTGRDCVKALNADELLIEDCDIGPSGVRDPSNAEGIDVIGSIGVTIRRCHVHDTATNGIYLKGGTRNGLVERCLVRNTGKFSGILLGQDTDPQYMRDGAEHEAIDCTARNNIIVNTGAAGLGTYSGRNVLFERNTLISVARELQAALWIVSNTRDVAPEGICFRNNIVLMFGARPMFFVGAMNGPLHCQGNVCFNPDQGGLRGAP